MPARATPQLEAVYHAVESARDHPTAQLVFERVQRVLPRVSLSTVYRNLDKLSRDGRLRVLRVDSGVSLYDAVTRAHDHFFCEECGIVIDIDAVVEPVEEDDRLPGHRVRRKSTTLYGTCHECSERGTH